MANFAEVYRTDVGEHKEKKDGLTYLSWTWAWAEFMKFYPDATYEVQKFNGLPYVYDPLTGYMVYVTVTAGGISHEMWLPVMDEHKKAMKSEPYTVKTRYNEFTVRAATMFDINTSIMRCLTKCLAMFGLGLYIYAGEDIPEEAEEEAVPLITEEQQAKIRNLTTEEQRTALVARYGAFYNWTAAAADTVIKKLEARNNA